MVRVLGKASIASTAWPANSKHIPHVHVSAPVSLPKAPLPLAIRLRRAGLTAALFALLGGLLYLKAIPCAFARAFHRPCPGCGSTRAVIALLHGEWAEVFRTNPFGPVMAVLIGLLAVQSIVSLLVHGDFRAAGEGVLGRIIKRGVFVVAALEIALWVARWFGAFGGPVPV
jgi:hypothetical protein